MKARPNYYIYQFIVVPKLRRKFEILEIYGKNDFGKLFFIIWASICSRVEKVNPDLFHSPFNL